MQPKSLNFLLYIDIVKPKIVMINEKYARRFCCEDISKIYGYKEAVADKEKMWDIHHCLGLVWSREQLIEMGLYYNQPAERLMFVTRSQHKKLHFISGEETRKKMSASRKGKQPNKGKILNDEWKKHLSESKKGRKMTEKQRKNISNALKGKPKSEEARKKMSEAAKKRCRKCRKVLQYTLNGEFAKEWVSAMEIQRVLGFSQGNIYNCCNGKQKSAYGFVWRYAN